MKREFLQNLKVGELPLSKEIIDAIMAENGRDIEAAKKPYEDYESIKEQLQTAKEGLKAFEGVDVAQMQQKIQTLQNGLDDKEREWQAKMDAKIFDDKVKDEILAARGKNHKAISALLDMETLRASKNQEADIKAAVDKLKAENEYLFESGEVPPPYAGGTGNSVVAGAKYSQEIAAIRAASGLKNE